MDNFERSELSAPGVQTPPPSVRRILIVDDEPSIIFAMRGFLLADGCEVESATDARDALRLLADHDFDVVITDIVLPQSGGIELLQAIRTAAPLAQVIMMTGGPSVDTAAAALRSGAFDYLIKPVSRSTLLGAVRNAARLKALDQERRREQKAKEQYQQELQASVMSLTAANDQLHKIAAFREEVEQITRHDLKGPLSTIFAAPALIRKVGGSLNDKQLSYLAMIENAGRLLLEMIHRSLDLFKIEQGMYSFRPQPVDLLGVAREVVEHNEPLMRVKCLSAAVLLDGCPVTTADTFLVQGERMLCYSMLGNLVTNALEASPADESVTLRFERNTMSVSIRNRGAVPLHMRDRFFEKFSTHGKEHGTGLGTYSAKLIADIHHARIAVDSSESDFTIVTVSFPPCGAS